MLIEEKDDATVITFQDRTGMRAKALYSIEAIYYAAATLGLLFAGRYTIPDNPLLGLGMLGAAGVCGIAFRRYLMRVTLKETIQINADGVVLSSIRKGRQSTIGYAAANMRHLRFVGFIKPIDHSMRSQTFDYLGLQTQQEVVNAVTSEGNIAFEYGIETIYFGRGVPSWDAAILNNHLIKRTDGRLFIADLPEEIPDEIWNK